MSDVLYRDPHVYRVRHANLHDDDHADLLPRLYRDPDSDDNVDTYRHEYSDDHGHQHTVSLVLHRDPHFHRDDHANVYDDSDPNLLPRVYVDGDAHQHRDRVTDSDRDIDRNSNGRSRSRGRNARQ